MRGISIQQSLLPPFILTLGFVMGCSTSGDNTASCGMEPCDDRMAISPVPGFPFRVTEISHVDCPVNTIILKGTMEDAPYELLADAGVEIFPGLGGYMDVYLEDDNFIHLVPLQDTYSDQNTFVGGLLKLPNVMYRQRVVGASRIYVGPDYRYIDFHLFVEGPATGGEVTGCIDGYTPPPSPSP